VEDVQKLIEMFKTFAHIVGIIHAQWCGHCTRMMPQYRQLVSQGKNTIPAFDVEESKLEMVNSILKQNGMKELSADAYPTANIYGAKASVIKSVTPDIKEVERALNAPPASMSMAPVSPSTNISGVVSPSSANTSGVVSPSTGAEDQVKSAVPETPRKVGGSLASIAGSAAYHLAPAAVLLATAAVTLKRCRKGRKKGSHKRRA
jgi:thiol-disulfide isomerase/thioredoxin